MGYFAPKSSLVTLFVVSGQSGGSEQPGDGDIRVDNFKKVTQKTANSQPRPLDLATSVKGMYRLLDLINESGSNGSGKDPSEV